MADASEHIGGITLRDYLNVVWRWKWLIALIIVASTLTAYYASASQTPQYAATTSMLYERPIDVSNPLSGDMSFVDPTTQQLDVASVSTIIYSPDMQKRVLDVVGQGALEAAPYSVSAAPTDESAAATSTNVATITVTSSDPAQAARLANAYAAAFIARRKDRQIQQISQAERVIQSELKSTVRGSSDYLILEQRLRDLEIRAATATGDFSIVTPAQAPSAPFSPRPKRSAVLGFGVGVFFAVGLAFVLEQLNTRLRDYRETSEILQLPVIGRIPALPKKYLTEHGLAVIEHPEGRASEAFRMLRGNLEFVNVDEDARSILVTSCRQGEGKSMTVANLAATLALAGKKIVVVDGDLRRPQMHMYFELPNEAGLSTVLTGRDALETALQDVVLSPRERRAEHDRRAEPRETSGRLRVLTAGPETPAPGEMIASKRFAGLMEELKDGADLVLVDSPAIMAVGDAGALATAVDGLIVLVDIQAIKRPTLVEVRDVLDPMPCRKLGIIVVRERLQASESYRYAYYRYQRA